MSDDDGEFTVVSQVSRSMGAEKELRQSFTNMLSSQGMDSFMESVGNFLSDEEFFEMSSMDVFKDMYEETQKKSPSPPKSQTKPMDARLAKMRKELQLEEIKEEENKRAEKTIPTSVSRPGQFNVSVSTFFTEGDDDDDKALPAESNSSRRSDSDDSFRSRRANALIESHSKTINTTETPRPRGRRRNLSANESSTENNLRSSTGGLSNKILMKPIKESERSRSRSRSRGRTPTRERPLASSLPRKPSPTTPRRHNLSRVANKSEETSALSLPRRRIAATQGPLKTQMRHGSAGVVSRKNNPNTDTPKDLLPVKDDSVQGSALQHPRKKPVSTIQAKKKQMEKERSRSVGRGRRIEPDEQPRCNQSGPVVRRREKTPKQEEFKRNDANKSQFDKENVRSKVTNTASAAIATTATTVKKKNDDDDDLSVEEFSVEAIRDKQNKSGTLADPKETTDFTTNTRNKTESFEDKKKKSVKIDRSTETNLPMKASNSDEAAESVTVKPQRSNPSRGPRKVPRRSKSANEVTIPKASGNKDLSQRNGGCPRRSFSSDYVGLPSSRQGRRRQVDRIENGSPHLATSHHSAQSNTSTVASSTVNSAMEDNASREATDEPRKRPDGVRGRPEVRGRTRGAGNVRQRSVSVGRVGTVSRSMSKSPLRGRLEERNARTSLRNSTSEHARAKTPTRVRREQPQPRALSRSEELAAMRTKTVTPVSPLPSSKPAAGMARVKEINRRKFRSSSVPRQLRREEDDKTRISVRARRGVVSQSFTASNVSKGVLSVGQHSSLAGDLEEVRRTRRPRPRPVKVSAVVASAESQGDDKNRNPGRCRKPPAPDRQEGCEQSLL